MLEPGSNIEVGGHTFQVEAVQDDGVTLFIRLEPGEGYESTLNWITKRYKSRKPVMVHGSVKAVPATVVAIKGRYRAGMQVELELLGETAK